MKHQHRELENWLEKVGSTEALAGLGELLPGAAMFAVDAERRVLWWSAGAEQLLGFRADEVLGERCLRANRCVECSVGCGIAEQGRLEDVPLRLFTASGRTIRLRKTARVAGPPLAGQRA